MSAWGIRLGPYEVLSPTGTGGSAEVFIGRGSATSTGPWPLRPFRSDSHRMKSSARSSSGKPALSRARTNPTFARFTTSAVKSGDCSLVMEYIDGETAVKAPR